MLLSGGSIMRTIFQSIIKHIYIYFIFAKNSLIGYLEYKANFFASLTMEIVFLFSKVVYVFVVYQVGYDINGVSPDEVTIFVGTYTIMIAIYTGLFMDNFYNFPEHIRTGTLDIYITKPLSLQFIVSMRHVNFALPIPNLAAGITMVAIAWNKLNIEVNFVNIAGYVGTIISSAIVAYSLFLIPQVLSFWTIRSGSITEITDKLWDFNNMPMSIYNKYIQRIGLFLIPVFFITNMPSMFILGKFNFIYYIWIIVAPILFMSILRLIWRVGVKNYSSASG